MNTLNFDVNIAPAKPGVYIWYSQSADILYIGKAANLRNRIKSYFALSNHSIKIKKMLSLAWGIGWIVLNNDTEAYHLEYALIQKYSPFFNVKLKDSKSYPYIAITNNDAAPRVFITHNRNIENCKYFGPYPKKWAVTDALAVILRVFFVRTCTDKNYKTAITTGKPCFSGQIKRCYGPCSGYQNYQEHRAQIDQLINFLEFQNEKNFHSLAQKGAESAAITQKKLKLGFRDRAKALAILAEKSCVISPHFAHNIDVFAIKKIESGKCIVVFCVRAGKIANILDFYFAGKNHDGDAFIKVLNLLDVDLPDPRYIFIDKSSWNLTKLRSLLREIHGERVQIMDSDSQDLLRILATAQKNANEYARIFSLHREDIFIKEEIYKKDWLKCILRVREL